MSTFELSREHEEFRQSVREFAEAEIAPHAAQWDRDHHFPTDVVQRMGKLGLMGLTAPEEFGGAGLSGEDGGFVGDACPVPPALVDGPFAGQSRAGSLSLSSASP